MAFLESFASCTMCVAILRYNTCSPSLTLMTNYNSAVRRIAALVSKANNDQIIPRIDHRGRIVAEQHLFLTNHEKRRRIVNAYFRRLKSQIRTSNSERKKKSAVLYKAMRWVIWVNSALHMYDGIRNIAWAILTHTYVCKSYLCDNPIDDTYIRKYGKGRMDSLIKVTAYHHDSLRNKYHE